MPKKVFELAKELDMRPLDLVEYLRPKGFAVRNHMSSLADQDAAKIVAQFKEAKKETKGAGKKRVRKKSSKDASEKKRIITVEGKEAVAPQGRAKKTYC